MAEGQRVWCRGQNHRPTWCLLPQDLRFPTNRRMNIYLMDAEHRLHANTQKVQKRRRWQSKRNNNHFSEVHFFSDGNQAYCFPSYFMFIIDFLPFMKAAVFIIKTSVSCSSSSSTWHAVSTDELLMVKHCSGAVLDLTGCVQYRPQRHIQLLKLRAGDSGPHTTITLVVRTEITETFWWKVDCFILLSEDCFLWCSVWSV